MMPRSVMGLGYERHVTGLPNQYARPTYCAVVRAAQFSCTVSGMAELTYAQRVARNIKTLAFAAGVSRTNLGEAMGLASTNSVSRRLNGHDEFSLSNLEQIGPLLDKTPQELANPPQ